MDTNYNEENEYDVGHEFDALWNAFYGTENVTKPLPTPQTYSPLGKDFTNSSFPSINSLLMEQSSPNNGDSDFNDDDDDDDDDDDVFYGGDNENIEAFTSAIMGFKPTSSTTQQQASYMHKIIELLGHQEVNDRFNELLFNTNPLDDTDYLFFTTVWHGILYANSYADKFFPYKKRPLSEHSFYSKAHAKLKTYYSQLSANACFTILSNMYCLDTSHLEDFYKDYFYLHQYLVYRVIIILFNINLSIIHSGKFSTVELNLMHIITGIDRDKLDAMLLPFIKRNNSFSLDFKAIFNHKQLLLGAQTPFDKASMIASLTSVLITSPRSLLNYALFHTNETLPISLIWCLLIPYLKDKVLSFDDLYGLFETVQQLPGVSISVFQSFKETITRLRHFDIKELINRHVDELGSWECTSAEIDQFLMEELWGKRYRLLFFPYSSNSNNDESNQLSKKTKW